MTTAEVKNNLHRLVVETEDDTILLQVEDFFTTLRQEKDWWHTISDKEKELIRLGKQQLEAGLGKPHQEVMF
ncbi:MAG: hypothetical protein RLZZ292_1006 [Bacteroidota bacterium]|jgi:hypothetical protein